MVGLDQTYFLFWMVLHHRVLTWDNLCRRGWQGPGLCSLCLSEGETIEHLFIHCRFTRNLWNNIFSSLHIVWSWDLMSIKECLLNWYDLNQTHKTLLIFICWGIWKCRNHMICDGHKPNEVTTGMAILSHYREF